MENVTDTNILLHHFVYLPYHIIFDAFVPRITPFGLIQATLQMGEVLGARRRQQNSSTSDQVVVKRLILRTGMIGMKIHVNVFTTAIREHKIFIWYSFHGIAFCVLFHWALYPWVWVGMRPLQRITGMAL